MDSSVYIDSLIIVLVYLIGDRIVTIFGENHDSYFKCEGESISINNYIEDRLLDNERSSVLLEFNKDTDNIKDLGSFNLINTVNNLKKKNIHIPRKTDKNDKRIKSVDYRDYFFNSYADDKYFLKLTRERINKEFIYPYFKKKNSFLKNGGNFFEELYKYKTHNVKIPERIYKFLENTYIPLVELEFEKIYFDLFKSGRKIESMIKKDYLKRIRHVWAKVADFYIILEMFDLNCIYNEKIILIGSEHCHNIENVMKKIGIKPEFKMTNYDENPKKCIKNNFFFKKYISLN